MPRSSCTSRGRSKAEGWRQGLQSCGTVWGWKWTRDTESERRPPSFTVGCHLCCLHIESSSLKQGHWYLLYQPVLSQDSIWTWSLLPAQSPESESESESHSVVSNSLWPQGLYRPWNSPGQNTGVGSLSLLQGIFPTPGLNRGLPNCRWILNQLSHKGSPGILEWVAYLFSSRSAWPRNWTWVSCTAGGFFTNWAIREAHRAPKIHGISRVSRVIGAFVF